MKQHETSVLEREIAFLHETAAGRSMPIGEIVAILSDKAKYLILVLLSIPFCQPISLPGLSTPFGMVILIVGMRVIIGGPVWLPKKIKNKMIPSHILERITSKALWMIKKMRKWIYPRMKTFCHSNWNRTISGIVIVLSGAVLLLPLPIPFSNMVTAWPIFLISIGHLEDDGLVIMMGYAFFSVAFLFFEEITLFILSAF